MGSRPGEKGVHSIFDVVSCLEGSDFDQAKLRVAEILSRSDLLCGPGTTGATHQQTYTKTDPESLLAPIWLT
jgi:hypothetical protein